MTGWPARGKGVATGVASWAEAPRPRGARARPRAPAPGPARAVRRVIADGERVGSWFMVGGPSVRQAQPSATSDVLAGEGWDGVCPPPYRMLAGCQPALVSKRG